MSQDFLSTWCAVQLVWTLAHGGSLYICVRAMGKVSVWQCSVLIWFLTQSDASSRYPTNHPVVLLLPFPQSALSEPLVILFSLTNNNVLLTSHTFQTGFGLFRPISSMKGLEGHIPAAVSSCISCRKNLVSRWGVVESVVVCVIWMIRVGWNRPASYFLVPYQE